MHDPDLDGIDDFSSPEIYDCWSCDHEFDIRFHRFNDDGKFPCPRCRSCSTGPFNPHKPKKPRKTDRRKDVR